MYQDFQARHRFPAYLLAFSLALLVGGCSWFSGDEGESKGQQETRMIEPIEGMKYFVGGPVMGHDKYGRMRMQSFNGEVKNPTARGLVIGFKEGPGTDYEFRTWLNGMPINKTFGFRDEDGLLWYKERFTFNSDGKVVVHQVFGYDDDKQIMQSTIEYLDPDDGEVLKKVTTEIPYAPPEDDDDWADEDDGEQDGE
jgi:hypothetical protein